MVIITASLDTRVHRDTLCWQGENSWRWVWMSIWQNMITSSSSSACCEILIMFLYSKATKDIPQTEWTQTMKDISRMQKSMGNLIMTGHFQRALKEKKFYSLILTNFSLSWYATSSILELGLRLIWLMLVQVFLWWRVLRFVGVLLPLTAFQCKHQKLHLHNL